VKNRFQAFAFSKRNLCRYAAVALLGDENAEVRKLACETLATLAHFADGRASVVAVDAVTAVNKLLKDADVGARDAAAEFMSSVSKAADGAAVGLHKLNPVDPWA
jgi:hypothetical protein